MNISKGQEDLWQRMRDLSAKRSRASLSRKSFKGGGFRIGAGRPKSLDRCPCGKMTSTRARLRGHNCASGV